MKINELIRNAMIEKNISTIKELSAITDISQARLYKIMEKEDVNISERLVEKLNRTLNLQLNGVREDDDSIGYKIFKLRSAMGFTAERLSLIANIGVDTIGKIERNIYKPSKITVKKLAKAFNMKEYELRKMLFEN